MTETPRTAVVGGGVMGLSLALLLQARGIHTEIYDHKHPLFPPASPGAGGMLAPYSELESGDHGCYKWGIESLKIWPSFAEEVGLGHLIQQKGSLLIAHHQDHAELTELAHLMHLKGADPQLLSTEDIQSIEPSLGGAFSQGAMAT